MTVESTDLFRHDQKQAHGHDIAREMLREIEESLIAAEVEGHANRSMVLELLEEHATIERSLGNHAAKAIVKLNTSHLDDFKEFEELAA